MEKGYQSPPTFLSEALRRLLIATFILADFCSQLQGTTTVDPSWIAPPGIYDTNQPGFSIRYVQAIYDLPNTLDRTEAQLNGTLIDPVTDGPADNVAFPGPNPDGSYDEPEVINYDISPASPDGHFNTPTYPDLPFAAIPGINGSTDNFALEVITFLDLPTGITTLVVNSDDGFRLFVGNQYIASNDRFSTNVAECDCGRGPADTTARLNVTTAGVYPIRLIYEQGQGGASLEFYSRTNGSNVLVNDLTLPQAIRAYRPTALRPVLDPADQTVVVGATATFSVALQAGINNAQYQWQKSADGIAFSDIPGATRTNYQSPTTTLNDSGTRYRARISIGTASLTTHSARLAVEFAPDIAQVHGDPSLEMARVTFTKPIALSSATNIANYAFSGGLQIQRAVLSTVDRKTVTLVTSHQTPSTAYTLTVNGVTDEHQNPVPANTTATLQSFVVVPGYVRAERWFGLPNQDVVTISNILEGFEYRQPDPTVIGPLSRPVEYYPTFQKPDESGDNYADRISGWITAPVSGNYTFYIATDDPGVLWLSTDESRANRRLLCSEPVWANPRAWVSKDRRPHQENISAPVALTAGKSYYIELLHHEGNGGDTAGVTWAIPGGPTITNGAPAILGKYLSMAVDPAEVADPYTVHPQSQTVSADSQVRLAVSYLPAPDTEIATDNAGIFFDGTLQWQRAEPGTTTFIDLPGETNLTYTTGYLGTFDSGAQYRTLLTRATGVFPSRPATLTVTPDNSPPFIDHAFSVDTTTLVLNFNKPVTPSIAYYSLDQGIKVRGLELDASDLARIVLKTSPMTPGHTYHLTISNLRDSAGNLISPNPTVIEFTDVLYPGDYTTLVTLPTDKMRPVGCLSSRGFLERIFQNQGWGSPNTILATEALLAGKLGTNQASTNLFIETGVVNYSRGSQDPKVTACEGNAGRVIPDAPFPVIKSQNAKCQQDNFAFEILTYVHLTPGIHRWGVNSDDGFRLSPATGIDDLNNLITLGSFDGGRGSSDTLIDFIVPKEGLYPMRLIYFEGVGLANLEWWERSLTCDAPGKNSTAPACYQLINGLDAAGLDNLEAYLPVDGTGLGAAGIFAPPTVVNGQISLSWQGNGVLQSAPTSNGPWTDVPSRPSNTYVADLTSGDAQFYRLFVPGCP
jgi:hypothetical protein